CRDNGFSLQPVPTRSRWIARPFRSDPPAGTQSVLAEPTGGKQPHSVPSVREERRDELGKQPEALRDDRHDVLAIAEVLKHHGKPLTRAAYRVARKRGWRWLDPALVRRHRRPCAHRRLFHAFNPLRMIPILVV